jgi:hypothetical protein
VTPFRATVHNRPPVAGVCQVASGTANSSRNNTPVAEKPPGTGIFERPDQSGPEAVWCGDRNGWRRADHGNPQRCGSAA